MARRKRLIKGKIKAPECSNTQGQKGKNTFMLTISKFIKNINCYFLHDEDEEAPASDYVWFYGFYFIVFVAILITLINL